jgi:hypothetical protein
LSSSKSVWYRFTADPSCASDFDDDDDDAEAAEDDDDEPPPIRAPAPRPRRDCDRPISVCASDGRRVRRTGPDTDGSDGRPPELRDDDALDGSI